MTGSIEPLGIPRRKVVGGIFAAFFIAGCDVPAPQVLDPATPTGSPSSLIRAIPKDRAVVVFLRGREFSASANSWRVSVNKSPVADLDIGMRHWQVVTPGTVQLKAEVVPTFSNFGLGLAISEKPVLNIKAQTGEIYVIELDPAFAGGPAFIRRDVNALREAANYIDAPLPAR